MTQPVTSVPPAAACAVPPEAVSTLPPVTPVQNSAPPVTQPPGELGGQTGPEPTRYGDWEKNGRCTDF